MDIKILPLILHRYPLDKFKKFIDDIHGTDQHYIPMFDAGIYVPNPNNASDIYEIFHNGNESDSFLKNPDGSLYIGSVWPGFTAFPDSWLQKVKNSGPRQ